MEKIAYYAKIGILAILVAIGMYSLYLQNTDGLHLTGATDLVPWGIFIPAGAFFVGVSAGTSIIGLLIHAFGRDEYTPMGTRAIIAGLCSLIAGMLFVVSDVGVPIRMLQIPWVLRNMTSPFVYSALSYYIFGILLLANLYYALKITRKDASQGDKKIAKSLAVTTFIFAIVALAAISGLIFATVKTRELWHSSLIPPHFVISGLVTGTAVMILGSILTSKTAGREILSKKALVYLAKLLALFLIVNIFFDIYDIIWINYSPTPEGIEALSLLTSTYLPSFALHLGGLLVALLILTFKKGRNTLGLAVSSILALVGVAAYRFNLIILGQVIPLLPDLHSITYTPTIHEISVITGIVALALLLYSIGTKVLPMEENKLNAAQPVWKKSK
jgi:molybdopterin-containing oxidoreductase family membrane subunit